MGASNGRLCIEAHVVHKTDYLFSTLLGGVVDEISHVLKYPALYYLGLYQYADHTITSLPVLEAAMWWGEHTKSSLIYVWYR